MKDPRYKKLAENLINYSVNLQKGERDVIQAIGVPDEIVIELIRAARKRKASPFVNITHPLIGRELLMEATQEQYEFQKKYELNQMQGVDAYIALRGGDNIFESSDVPSDRMKLASKIMRPVIDHRVKKTKWCVLRWPSPSMAQAAGKSTEAFSNFYFDVCTFDYSKFAKGSAALKKWMEKTDKVHIKGPGTDLRFSIKKIPAIPCTGEFNIPDGEVFTAPVKDSIEGTLYYNAPTVYLGTEFKDVKLTFKKGKIVEATSSNTKRLNQILDSDPGARYIGEFAIGFNPYVLNPMQDILFDEKIAGSFHFTPGQAYEQADNGNRSQVHWDMVSIQRKEWGGGEIWFDKTLIRKDGIFLPKDLQALNPKNLLKK
jgi:aminopeptidase